MIRRGWKHCAYPINTHMVLVVRPQIIAKLQFIWIRKVLFHFKIPLSPKFPDYPPPECKLTIAKTKDIAFLRLFAF